MNIHQAIEKAGGRKRLATMLGVASITTYHWKGELPQKHCDRLRVLRPSWFKKPRQKIEALPVAAFVGADPATFGAES